MIIRIIKAGILLILLIYASVRDIKTRIVPDCVSVMLIILGLCGTGDSELPSMILGFFAAFLPLLIPALIKPEKAVGGADIKMSGAAGFLLGMPGGLSALIIGMTLALIVISVRTVIKKHPHGGSFPLIPFLSVGIAAVYFIQNGGIR